MKRIIAGIALPSTLFTGYFAYQAQLPNPYLTTVPSGSTDISPPLKTSPFSQIFGKWVDLIFAYGAAYGRGKLHFKTGGWGNIETVERCTNQLKSQSLSTTLTVQDRITEAKKWIPKNEMQWETDWIEDIKDSGSWHRDGSFPTPLIHMFGSQATDEMLFEPAQRCHFRYVVPSKTNPSNHPELFGLTVSPVANSSTATTTSSSTTTPSLSSSTTSNTGHMPLCIHLPCAGDQFFDWRNRHFATPLASKHGIASLIIEAPSYGKRRRHNRQVRGAQVHRVADLVVGGLVQITESIALLTWMESYVPAHSKSNFGLCGISMGAEIATLYAAVTPIPTHVVAVMPAHSAIAIWHEGVLGDVSDWNYLATVMQERKGNNGNNGNNGNENNENKNNGNEDKQKEEEKKTKEKKKKEFKTLHTATEARNQVVNWLQHTDIQTFAKPYHWLPQKERPNVLLIGALDDAYIPSASTWKLAQHWSDTANVRWLEGGHCTTVVFHKKTILSSIVEIFNTKIPSIDAMKQEQKQKQ